MRIKYEETNQYLVRAEKQNKDLTQRLEESNDRINVLEQKIGSLQEENDKLFDQLTEAKNTIKDYEFERIKETPNSDASQFKETIDSLTKTLQDKEVELREKDVTIENQERALFHLDQEVLKLEKQLEEQTKTVGELRTELKNAVDMVKGLVEI